MSMHLIVFIFRNKGLNLVKCLKHDRDLHMDKKKLNIL